jgi:HD-GYP domain-containing protein (c-di-GMP phosphodiesterase class II)
MAFVDVYDALTSQRVYKKAFSHLKSRTIMMDEMTGHFDPDIVNVFLSIEDWFKEIAEKYRDDEDWEVSSLI